jgi:hypothetical protein
MFKLCHNSIDEAKHLCLLGSSCEVERLKILHFQLRFPIVCIADDCAIFYNGIGQGTTQILDWYALSHILVEMWQEELFFFP